MPPHTLRPPDAGGPAGMGPRSLPTQGMFRGSPAFAPRTTKAAPLQKIQVEGRRGYAERSQNIFPDRL